MKIILTVALIFTAAATFADEKNSRDLLQGRSPFLEVYWESYLQFITKPENCLDLSSKEPPNSSDFGFRISDVPDEVDVVNIAFGDLRVNDCHYREGVFTVCEPYICGLHLYGVAGVGQEDFEQLRDDIAILHGRGKLVKLAYGGEEYGNLFGGEHTIGIDAMVDNIVNAVNDLGLDGVDIANEQGGGSVYWFGADAEVGQQLYFLRG